LSRAAELHLRAVARAFAILALLSLAGCAHYPLNQPARDYSADSGYRFDKLTGGDNSDSLFVCLSFSGGGTRAAAMAYGALTKLRDTRIVWEGKTKRLLDEVDCISAISGGSFAAAYYGLFGDRLFRDFREKFLIRNVQKALKGQALNPANLLRLMSPYYGRIDLAAEFYGREIFNNQHYADLLALKQRPFVIVNATNLADGSRFEFTQEQFDLLGSDLGRFPLARAVAASSAFPFLLSPISLKNHPQAAAYVQPEEYQNALKSYAANPRRYVAARNRVAYLDKARRPFVHLMDGGLSDNIGLRAIENAYRRTDGFIRTRMDGRIRKLVIIVVNAKTEAQDTISQQELPPDLLTVAYKTATISLDNYSFETIETLKDLLTERTRTQSAVSGCQKILDRHCPGAPRLPALAGEIDPHVIEINFDMIKDPARRRRFLEMPTNFDLDAAAVDGVSQVAGELLSQSPAFQGLLTSIGQDADKLPSSSPRLAPALP
jgi:predicted acylesterase/phospholipase RssA